MCVYLSFTYSIILFTINRWFLLRLQEANKLKPVKKNTFVDLVMEDKISFDDGLIDEMAKKFRNEKKRVDLPLMLELYMKLFPQTELPKKIPKKKKASRKQLSAQKLSKVEKSASQQYVPSVHPEITTGNETEDARLIMTEEAQHNLKQRAGEDITDMKSSPN